MTAHINTRFKSNFHKLMKTFILTITFLILFSVKNYSWSQLLNDSRDFNNLLSIGQLYSSGGENYQDSLQKLSTPRLEPIISALKVINAKTADILQIEMLKKPSHEILLYWYIIREIHYNHNNEKPIADSLVVKKILSSTIDPRNLLDNYYSRILSGLSFYFNEGNLSNFNINLEKLELDNPEEKAILYFSLINNLIGSRIRVLQYVKNDKDIMKFIKKMPKINNNEYYCYNNFDFEDFEWIGYDKTKSYKMTQLSNFYSTLLVHFSTLIKIRASNKTNDVYRKSILSEPKYFQFSESSEDLKRWYDMNKVK